MIAVDLSKQQALDADPKIIQQLNFYWTSRSRWKYNKCFSLLKKQKNVYILDFSQVTVRVLQIYFALI